MRSAQKEEVSLSLSNIFKSSTIVFVALAISKVLTYIYRVVAARYFGPETYGLFSLALVISGWFIAVVTLGLSEGLIRYLAINRAKKKGEIQYAFSFTLGLLSITSIIGGFLLFVGAENVATLLHEDKLIIFLKIFSIAVPLTVIATPFLMTIRAFEKITAYSFIFNILQSTVKVLLLFALIMWGVGAQAISWSYVGGLAVVLAASYYYVRKRIPEIFSKITIKPKEKKDLRRGIIFYSLPLLLYGILSTLMYWIDSFSIGLLKDATAVGWYNAAVPIALLLTFAPELFIQLFCPMIYRYYAAHKKNTIKELSKQVTKWILIINLPLFVIMFMFPEVIINLLFGAEYIIAAGALRILAVSSLLSSLCSISMNLVNMVGKSKLAMWNTIAAVIVNAVLNAIFIPMEKIAFIENADGINGAAFATLISLVVFNVLFFVQACKYAGVFPLRRKMFNVVFAMLPALLIAYLAKTQIDNPSIYILILVGIAFVALYAGFLFLARAFDKYDWEIVRKVVKIPTSFAKASYS